MKPQQEPTVTKNSTVVTTNKVDFQNYKGKYRLIVEKIYDLIGGKENYNKYYNCITRLRFDIKDKEVVDLEQLKKVNLVKGINWNKSELQIIFGGEVYKIREEFDKYLEDLKKGQDKNQQVQTKVSKHEKVIKFLKGVVMPTIPALMASGLLTAIQAILTQSGALANVDLKTNTLVDYDLGTAIFYVLSKTVLSLIGVLFCYTTVKTLKGNTVMAIVIGLTLATPLIADKHWTLFYLFGDENLPVNVTAYASAILPNVVAGIIYVYLDKWIKMWMPTSVDLVFRHPLTYALTIFPIFLLLGPFLGIVEGFVTAGAMQLGMVGYGIGAGIFGFFWQPLVLTGVHHTVMTPLKALSATGQNSILLLATSTNALAQFGASLAVLVRTKNTNVRQACINAAPSCLLGITEPVMYGVNLQKFWPFIYGLVGGGAACFVAGLLKASPLNVSGSGIMNFLRYIGGGTQPLINIAIIDTVAILTPFLLTLFFYHERISELKQTTKASQKLVKLLSILNNQPIVESKKQLSSMIIDETNLLKENKTLFIDYEKQVITLINLQAKIRAYQSKEDAKKEKLAKKISRLQKTKKINQELIDSLIIKFDLVDEKSKVTALRKVEANQLFAIEKNKVRINQLQINYFILVDETLQKIFNNNLDEHHQQLIRNNFFNAFNSIDINYQIIDKKDHKINFNKLKKAQKELLI